MAILAEIKAVADTIKAVADVVKIFNGARSVVLSIYNNTNDQLLYYDATHSHGGWAEPPPQVIPPQKVAVFGSQSLAWSVGTGTEGIIRFTTPQKDILQFQWDNPFIGGNSCSAMAHHMQDRSQWFFQALLPAKYVRVTHICGSGNTEAKMLSLIHISEPTRH